MNRMNLLRNREKENWGKSWKNGSREDSGERIAEVDRRREEDSRGVVEEIEGNCSINYFVGFFGFVLIFYS